MFNELNLALLDELAEHLFQHVDQPRLPSISYVLHGNRPIFHGAADDEPDCQHVKLKTTLLDDPTPTVEEMRSVTKSLGAKYWGCALPWKLPNGPTVMMLLVGAGQEPYQMALLHPEYTKDGLIKDFISVVEMRFPDDALRLPAISGLPGGEMVMQMID